MMRTILNDKEYAMGSLLVNTTVAGLFLWLLLAAIPH
jgi:hypothetical protein